jgi:transcriptional regulator with XRE-family HTH domain
MKEFREHDEIEQDDKDRLYTLDEIMSNTDVEGRKLSTHERSELLLDIHRKLLSENERDELVKEINGNLKSRDIDIEMSIQSKSNTGEIQESKEWVVNMWEPRIRDIPVESEEQIMTVLQNLIPGILKHRMFDNLRHQISMHIRTTQEFGHRNRVTYREINEFSKQNEYPSSTIEAWVLHGIQPNSYRIINENALTREEAGTLLSKIKEKLHGLDTQIELDTRLDTPFHESRTKSLPSFRRDYENACGFYRFLDEFVDGGVLNDIAERVGIDRLVARRYVEDKMIPRLIRKVLNQSLDEIENIDRRVIIQDEVQYEQVLSRHPHIRDMDNFTEMDRHMRAYLKLKHLQHSDTLPEISQEELAANLGISGPRLNVYLSDKSAPKLQSILLLHENARLGYERRLSPVAFEHRIEPELVFRELHQYKGMERIDIDDFATSLRTIYEQTAISSKIQWLDIRRYAPTGQDWFKRIVKFCAKGRTEIEHALNQQLGFDTGAKQRLRLGVISSRIYLRLEDTQETDWMQLYSNEMFHFHDSKHVDELLRETKTRLDIKGDISLSRLVHQITDYNRSMVKRGMNTDLHYNSSYLKGSTLSLLLDSCGIAIQELEDEISCIGRIDRRLIRNPKFSKDSSEIDKAFARLFGAGLSDGHIDQFHVFCYGDADVDRVRIFKKHVEFFGNVEYTETISKRGFHDVRYSSVLGRMLEKRGFTAGDKTVQNGGIPDFILNGPEEVFVEYPKQLWAEDGEFSSTSASHKAFRWTRSMALIDPEKDLKYGIDRAFSQEITSFMQAHGTYTEECSFPDRESYPRYVLTKTDIDRLKQDKDIAISNTATWLSSFIESNKPLLMKHEISLLDRIGISTRDSYDDITYYIETGRVSVLFRASTVSLYDAMKVAVIAAPDDKQKRLRVIEWIQSNYALYKQACHEMMMRGYQISLDVNDNP